MCYQSLSDLLAIPPDSAPVQRHPVSSNVSFYFLDDVQCTGKEDRLSECEHNEVGDHNCHIRYEQAGVKCNGEKASIFYMLFTLLDYYIIVTLDQECNETDVRLVDGPHEGQVELCLNGVWYSVCSNGWDVNDARVVCRQLGYDGCKYYTFYYGSPAPVISLITPPQHLIHCHTILLSHCHWWTMLTAEEMRAS